MDRVWKTVITVAAACLFLCGCSVLTVDEMYYPPKRSEAFDNLQSVMDAAMSGLEYCAPLSGENQQNVQMADLNGDGTNEYLLFAKGTEDRPLRILVFGGKDGSYSHIQTIECSGSAFDQVEYVNMDNTPGMEIVVGRQLNDQVIRSVSVYSLRRDGLEQLVSVNYTKFLTVDLDNNMLHELFVLRPGQTDADEGVAELYAIKNGSMERSNEVNMSRPADKLKRIITGGIDEEIPAVFVASMVDETALVTDIFILSGDLLKNVTFSNESGTGVQTMRNFYVFADDIDNDGVVELPALISMKPRADGVHEDRHHLIRWYAMTKDGREIDKMYTFHNFVAGWYLQLDSRWAPRVSVETFGNSYEFYLWNKEYKKTEKILTITALTGQNREEQALESGRFVLLRTESTVYTAKLEEGAQTLSLSQDSVIYSFRMIQQDWKTGET
ncbi:MAG: hypothetical protein J6A74_04585 [Oscillospiraceae bacterium]|nr:hypothetical protein [Oscillospiraceae bacterium]